MVAHDGTVKATASTSAPRLSPACPNSPPRSRSSPSTYCWSALGDALTRLRGLGRFSSSQINEINNLTRKVFTTRQFLEGRAAQAPLRRRKNRRNRVHSSKQSARIESEGRLTRFVALWNRGRVELVFTTAVFGQALEVYAGNFNCLARTKSQKIACDGVESAKSGSPEATSVRGVCMIIFVVF